MTDKHSQGQNSHTSHTANITTEPLPLDLETTHEQLAQELINGCGSYRKPNIDRELHAGIGGYFLGR